MGQTNVREVPERGDSSLYTRAAVVAESLSDEERSVEVIASTEDMDRHGTILRQNWRLDDYKRNPVVLYSHNRWDLPIGTASEIRVAEGKLRAKLTFSTADLNEEADRVWRNVKAKVIRGVSVGFWPHTVTYERHDDRDVVVLDDNELFEISMTPVPSNPQCLAEIRARAIATRSAPEPQPSPTAPPSPPEQQPATPERSTMPDENKPKTTNDATPSVARALGLPPGSSESDIVAAATRCRELELQIIAIAACSTSHEALGALRAIKEKADSADTLAAENAKLKAERDEQNFTALITKGTSNCQLVPAEVKHYQELFDKAKERGNGADVVAQLEGYLKVAPRKLPQRHTAPSEARGGGESAQGLTWNGKTYAELKPAQRAALKSEDPDLWKLMKEDFDKSAA